MKQALEDEIKFANKDMSEAKKSLAGNAEKKAAAEGDLAVTSKELEGDVATLGSLHRDCLTKAQDFEAAAKSRDEELKALAEAKKVISETTGGAETLAYGLNQNQVSFLQVARSALSSEADLANFEAVRLIRDLARKENAPALAQLAQRMAATIRATARTGEDPFAKVKGLISDMITKLEADASADASHKAYCDKELAESTAK